MSSIARADGDDVRASAASPFGSPPILRYRGEPASTTAFFGVITAVAGLLSTLIGGVIADRMRPRYPGSYFLVSGVGMLLAAPILSRCSTLLFRRRGGFCSARFSFGFLNTGPSNTALANVTFPSVRATAFALNILVIHALGDALAFPTIGYISGHTNMNIGFLVISGMMLVSGLALVDRNKIPRRRHRRASSGKHPSDVRLTSGTGNAMFVARLESLISRYSGQAAARSCRCTSFASASRKATAASLGRPVRASSSLIICQLSAR